MDAGCWIGFRFSGIFHRTVNFVFGYAPTAGPVEPLTGRTLCGCPAPIGPAVNVSAASAAIRIRIESGTLSLTLLIRCGCLADCFALIRTLAAVEDLIGRAAKVATLDAILAQKVKLASAFLVRVHSVCLLLTRIRTLQTLELAGSDANLSVEHLTGRTLQVAAASADAKVVLLTPGPFDAKEAIGALTVPLALIPHGLRRGETPRLGFFRQRTPVQVRFDAFASIENPLVRAGQSYQFVVVMAVVVLATFAGYIRIVSGGHGQAVAR